MGFDDIVGKIKSNVAAGLFPSEPAGNGATDRWPIEFRPFTNNPNYNDGSWKGGILEGQHSYAFRVVSIDDVDAIGVDDWVEFELQINPQEITQDEVFAIQVTPTLRGVLVEHQGVLIKDIVISGTTGLSPKRRTGGSTPSTGKPYKASGHSGFEEFHELRSYFRAYAEAKRQDKTGKLRMIFINTKDGERIFVEPQKFTMKRTRAFLYDYVIALKGIGNADLNAQEHSVPQDDSNSFTRALELVNYATGVITNGLSFIKRTERDVVNKILEPLRVVNNFLQALSAAKKADITPTGVTRRFVEQLVLESARIRDNLSEVIGVDIREYNAINGRTPTLVGSPTRQQTYQEMQILNGFNSINKMGMTLMAMPNIFAADPDEAANAAEAAYQSRVSGATDGTVDYINDGNLRLQRYTTVDTVTILGGDTIQSLAARTLGDPDLYRELILLNKLRPPYISDVAAPNVLTHGDPILVPSKKGVSAGSGVRMNKDYEVTKNLDFAKKSFGVDLRIDDDFDIVFANFGDFDLTAGVDNMAQAILMKILLENGSLKRHPWIGSSLQIGSKSKDLKLARSNLMKSLNQDARVEGVPFLSLQQTGDTITVKASIRLVGASQPIPLTVEV